MTLLTTILAFAVTLGVLIIIHEFGHYWVARRCGVKVMRFSIGFGKSIFTWKSKKDPDATEWTVSALPLGGYVRMLDERDETCLPIRPEDKNRTFNSKKAWQRLLIVLAGPVANLLLASFIYAALFMHGTEEALPVLAEPAIETPAAKAGLKEGDQILSINGQKVATFSDMTLDLMKSVGSVVNLKVLTGNGVEREISVDLQGIVLEESKEKGDVLSQAGFDLMVGKPTIKEFIGVSAGQRDGLMLGDQILEVGKQKVRTPSEFVKAIQSYPAKEVEVLVRSEDGKERAVIVTPDAAEGPDGKQIGKIGASIGSVIPLTKVSYGPFESIGKGFKKTWDTAWFSVEMVGKMIIGEVSLKNISGPVTIADYAGQTARIGLVPFLSFLALVSISLGVLNLLPIPMLDGGHVLYYSVEILRGKPVSENFQSVAAKVGIAALVCLTALALFNDLNRLLP